MDVVAGSVRGGQLRTRSEHCPDGQRCEPQAGRDCGARARLFYAQPDSVTYSHERGVRPANSVFHAQLEAAFAPQRRRRGELGDARKLRGQRSAVFSAAAAS